MNLLMAGTWFIATVNKQEIVYHNWSINVYAPTYIGMRNAASNEKSEANINLSNHIEVYYVAYNKHATKESIKVFMRWIYTVHILIKHMVQVMCINLVQVSISLLLQFSATSRF